MIRSCSTEESEIQGASSKLLQSLDNQDYQVPEVYRPWEHLDSGKLQQLVQEVRTFKVSPLGQVHQAQLCRDKEDAVQALLQSKVKSTDDVIVMLQGLGAMNELYGRATYFDDLERELVQEQQNRKQEL